MMESMCLAEARFMFTTIIHVYAEEATDINQFHPPGICIPLILANTYRALGISIHYNRNHVTLDSNEAALFCGNYHKVRMFA